MPSEKRESVGIDPKRIVTHTCRRTEALSIEGSEPLLFDGCARCLELSQAPHLLLDAERTGLMWDKMVSVEHGHIKGHYRSAVEARAGKCLYEIAVFLERHTDVSPWELEVGEFIPL